MCCSILHVEVRRILNYYKSIEENGVVYSVDMVRLEIKTNCSDGDDFCQWLMDKELEIGDIGYYQSFKAYTYRHLFVVPCGDSTVSIGLQLNDDKRHDSYKGYIEFNPNKVAADCWFNELITRVRMTYEEIIVKRWDFAVDIPVAKKNCMMLKDNRNYTLYQGQKGETEYLGRRSHGGFVKLYDKKVESNLDYDLTRLEVTIEGLADFQTVPFPGVKIVSEQLDISANVELKDTELALVELIRLQGNYDYWLRRLGRYMREKIKPYLLGVDTDLVISDNAYRQLIKHLELYQRIKVK